MIRPILLSACLLASPAIAQEVGRWMVVATSTEARHTVLVDTKTGEVWQICRNPTTGLAAWCGPLIFLRDQGKSKPTDGKDR